MALIFWWLLPVGLAVAAGAAWLVFRSRRTADAAPVAHADRLTGLPSYQRALGRHRRWLWVLCASAVLLAGAALTAAARPAQQHSIRPEQANRDIVLCLDVSGSMVETDAAIVNVFTQLVKEFEGERIGLTIFDSSAVQVFPLTDDYELVKEQLDVARTALGLDSDNFGFFEGTYAGAGSSLIGDGLASCVTGFPKLDSEQRSRTVVLATDNLLAGTPLFTLDEAAALAQSSKVRVYAINPNGQESGKAATAAQRLQDAATATGGGYFALDNADAVSKIVGQVQSTEAARLTGAPVVSVADVPALPLVLALVGLAGMLLALWKVRP
ncbi:VWA domain-containing protein [Arthrobacter sp. 35W]|uniref:VWA domain-containing protein n=1 Tax=Arthrobacter sp. 35W TaxID=1132441 RepID=UPI000422FBCB|nr:VWA domain-containing protein [Arthrobacter sp. 35W]